jgi:DNA-binding response OmpR family regulator
MQRIEPSTTPATILVVDDDIILQELLDELLAAEGYVVHGANCIADATAAIARVQPDLVILDVRLPDGNGLDLCAQLRADPKTVDLPVLFLSASGRNSHFVAQGLDVGGYDVLSKPFFNDELLARVRVLVRLRRLQQRLIEQERDRAMLATAGAAAHNLGQPLTAALGLTDLLLESDLTEEQRQDVEMLAQALRQMGDIVRQIQEVQHFVTQPYLEGSSDLQILDLDRTGTPQPQDR